MLYNIIKSAPKSIAMVMVHLLVGARERSWPRRSKRRARRRWPRRRCARSWATIHDVFAHKALYDAELHIKH